MASTVGVAQAAGLLSQLQDAVNSGNFPAAEEALVQLKVALMSFPSLPPTLAQSSTAAQEMQVARDTFEAACILSTKKGSSEEFEKHFAQLRPFYAALKDKVTPSTQRALILGLNLLRLLVENKLDVFHVELELLDDTDTASPLVAFPLELQQALQQGYFGKAAGAGDGALPSPLYAPFVQALQDTARGEAASCAAAAYPSMTLQAAAQRLHLPSAEAVAKYAAAEQPEWRVEGDRVIFHSDSTSSAGAIPAQAVMHQTLAYATELERIV